MVDAILDLSKSHSCKLHQLNLQANDVGPAGGIKLAELIAHSPHLRVLNINNNGFNNTVTDALFESLRLRSHSLEEFDVNCQDLGPRGVTLLLDILRKFTALRVLKAGASDEGDLGAHALAQFLLSSGGSRLVKLQMLCTHITKSGVLELAGALAKAYALRKINMVGSPLGPRGAAAILDALATASTMPMDAIYFCGCEIGYDGASALGRLILHRGCRKVHLAFSEMYDIEAKAIMDSAAISTTCAMSYLNLSHNPIGDEGVKYIFDKMMQSRRRLVHKLDISGIEMGVKAATAVKLAVETYGIPYRVKMSRHVGDVEADDILEGVKKWERDFRPSRAAILRLSV